MPLRCRGDGERILGRHFTDFADIVQSGVDNLWNSYGSRVHLLESWTKRSIIRDEIVHLLCEYTDGVQEASWRRAGNATYFYYYDAFIIKVNKLSDFLFPNINSTEESRNYFTQQLDLFSAAEEDEWSRTGSTVHFEPTSIFLGYVPTENDPRNPQSYLTCFNDRGRLEWDIPLKKGGGAPPPVTILTPSDGGEPSRVRVRPAAAKKAAG